MLRSYRRSGVGGRAAVLLWNSLPAHWIVRVAEANRDGLRFWEETIRHVTDGAFATTAYRGQQHTFRVFSVGSSAVLNKGGRGVRSPLTTCRKVRIISD